jgi:hypothetical protein
LATPNYSYEKRQRELAKKRKAEEKRQKKLNRGSDDSSTGETPLTGTESEDSGVQPPPPDAGGTE